MTTQLEPTIEQRKIIYQARRGLKELDIFIDPYVKQYYLHASDAEQHAFAKLLSHEDPDLLNFFMDLDKPAEPDVANLITKLKQLVQS